MRRITLFGMLAALAFVSAANAGSYTVLSCGGSPTKRADAWAYVAGNATVIHQGDSCANPSADTDGKVDFGGALWLRDEINGATRPSPTGSAAQIQFSAPPAAAITSLRYDRDLHSIDQGWEVWLRDQTGAPLGDSCVLQLNESSCGSGARMTKLIDPLPPAVTKLVLGLDCVGTMPCLAGSGPLYDFAIAIYSSEVTIEENVAPSVGTLTTSGVGPGGWFGAAGQLGMSGSDTLGIRRFEVLDGDQVVGTVERTCVDWSVLPCAEPAAGLSASASASTAMSQLSLAQGSTRALRIRAIDAAGNAALSAPVTVAYDPTPRTPQSIGKGVQRGTTIRTVDWTVGGSGAPAVSAVARICTGPAPEPTSCEDRPVAPEGPLALDIPASAHATARISITDAAGNTGASELVTLPPDTTAPLAPVLLLNSQDGAVRRVAVASEDGARLDAKLCAVGGTCSSLPTVTSPTLMTVTLPEPGAYDLVVTATDPSGNTSGASTLRLTRNAPLGEPKSIDLRVRVSSNLGKRRISISGSVVAGSTSRIALTLVARTRRGRAITKRTTISVPASGRFSKRLRLPASATSKRAVRLTLTPTLGDGWRDTRYNHTIRP